MSTTRKITLLTLPALLAGLIVLASSYAFDVKPAGRIDGTVVFDFCDVSNKAIDVDIVGFTVSERSGGRWKPVWSLTGQRARVRRITYGTSVPGLNESVRPGKLRLGSRYAVFASDGKGGACSRYFAFGVDGVVVLPDSVDP